MNQGTRGKVDSNLMAQPFYSMVQVLGIKPSKMRVHSELNLLIVSFFLFIHHVSCLIFVVVPF
jgi:hypothetical protein